MMKPRRCSTVINKPLLMQTHHLANKSNLNFTNSYGRNFLTICEISKFYGLLNFHKCLHLKLFRHGVILKHKSEEDNRLIK